MQCSDCRAQGSLERYFREGLSWSASGSEPAPLYCPPCWDRYRTRRYWLPLAAFAACAAACGALALRWPRSIWADAALLAAHLLGFAAAVAPATLAHELGHALAARCAGRRVLELRFGGGVPLARLRLFGAELRLGSIPNEGSVGCSRPAARGLRWRLAATTLGGPLTNLALMLACAPLFEAARRGSPAAAFAIYCALANAWVALLALLPLYALEGGPSRTTDGGKLWQYARASRSELDAHAALVRVYELSLEWQQLRERGDLAGGERLARAGLAAHPHIELRVLLGCSLGWRDADEARELFRACLAEPGLGDYARETLKCLFANATGTGAPEADRELAEQYSREAFERVGWSPYVRIHRAWQLAERGRAREALALLAATRPGGEPLQRAAHEIALARAHARLGHAEQAARHAARAQALDPCAELALAEPLPEPAPSSSAAA